MFRSIVLIVAALGLALTSQAPLRAQGSCPQCDLPPGCRGNGNQNGNGNGNSGRNCQLLEITIDSDIDFGRLVLTGDGEGQVLLDLNTGEKRTVGSIDDLGGMAISGRAFITGAPNEAVRINLPTTVNMRDPTGGSAEMRDVVTDLPALPVLDANGRLEFRFSGTLYTDATSSMGGKLRGRVPISVEYQ
ncbi:MAG: DUF4402 domain-containing protein [Pseudomonadota bacterium]